MTKITWPKISIITPTLNSSRTIEEYFSAITRQKYKGKVEILILDGGSNDSTLKVAKEYGAKVYFNKLKTAEAGKALGVKKSTGSICAFIDSDNILSNDRWLEKLTKPFMEDLEIIVSEPIKFTYRKVDHWLTRYFALIGAGDPTNLFIGNYDKYSYITNKWTGLKLNQDKKNGYIKIKLENIIPTIGANGSLVRKTVFDKYLVGDYLFDVDLLEHLVKDSPIYMAKVNESIIHLFSGDISTFIRKQRRRIRDYLFYQNNDKREKPTGIMHIYLGILKFIFSCILIFPLLLQALIGYFRKKDIVWLFHPLACYITLFSYGYESIRALFIKEEYSRNGWKQ